MVAMLLIKARSAKRSATERPTAVFMASAATRVPNADYFSKNHYHRLCSMETEVRHRRHRDRCAIPAKGRATFRPNAIKRHGRRPRRFTLPAPSLLVKARG